MKIKFQINSGGGKKCRKKSRKDVNLEKNVENILKLERKFGKISRKSFWVRKIVEKILKTFWSSKKIKKIKKKF